MIVLGLHGGVTIGQHEPAAALCVNGKIVAACEEERYLRIKSAYGYLPYYSIKACLEMAGISYSDIDLVVTPGATYDDFDKHIADYLRHNFGSCPRLERVHHQMAHLNAAFYGGGLDESLVLSLDATGDGACGMLAHATKKDGITVLETIPTSHSIGFFYTLITYYLGFVDGDEYKVMGLAPYGQPNVDLSKIIRPVDGGWDFDFSFVRSGPPLRSPFEPVYASKIVDALGQPHRVPGAPMTQFFKDVARSTQDTFEKCLLQLVKGLMAKRPSCRNLSYAGGVALNCCGNRALLYNDILDNIYVSPVSSDRGLAIGCAYAGAVSLGDVPWPLHSPYLGSAYSNDAIRKELTANSCPFDAIENPAETASELLTQGKIIGWFQGRSEAGARALGSRSILAKCESAEMRDQVNARIKYREEFRPFAPSVLFEEAETFFDCRGKDFPTMSFTLDARPEKRDRMAAVVHVDQTARVQTVRSSNNELYYDLIRRYAALSGTPIILNTSYNLKGQPIVESPRDALMTFYGCGLDNLVMGNFLVRKR